MERVCSLSGSTVGLCSRDRIPCICPLGDCSYVQDIGKYSPYYKESSEYQLCVPLLKQLPDKVASDLQKHKDEGKVYICSILTNGRTHRKHRCAMELVCIAKRVYASLSQLRTPTSRIGESVTTSGLRIALRRF